MIAIAPAGKPARRQWYDRRPMEVRMKRFAMVLVVMLAGGVGSVSAQTPGASASASTETPWYAELTGAATFGHTSSGSVGFEGGYRLKDQWQLFVEVGRMSNVATADLDQRALIIAGGTGSSSVSTKQRAVYFDIGGRYEPPPYGMWHPYVLLGLGAASVKTSTTFGASLLTFNLGNDLSSTLTKFFVTAGAGVTVPLGGRYLADISYRYGHISPKSSAILDDVGINTQRIQAGIGVKF
jgi:opacity protein-like surface antigen